MPFQVKLVTYDVEKHITMAVQSIRELKERIQCAIMIMGYKRMPKRFVIEVVKEVTKIVNLIPKESYVHMIQWPRQLVTGLLFRLPPTTMGKHVQGHVGGSKDT